MGFSLFQVSLVLVIVLVLGGLLSAPVNSFEHEHEHENPLQ